MEFHPLDRAVVIIVLLLSVLGCSAGDASELNELRTKLDVLAKRLELNLPVGTQIVHVETEWGMDDAIFAKLLIPVTGTEEFIESLHATRYRASAADLFGRDRGAWDPHRAKVLRVGRSLLPTNRGLVVGLDDSRSDVVVLYVLNHGI